MNLRSQILWALGLNYSLLKGITKQIQTFIRTKSLTKMAVCRGSLPGKKNKLINLKMCIKTKYISFLFRDRKKEARRNLPKLDSPEIKAKLNNIWVEMDYIVLYFTSRDERKAPRTIQIRNTQELNRSKKYS